MRINRIQPVYNFNYYWKRWRPYAHRCLNNYTSDNDIHANLDFDLYLLFRKLATIIDYTKSIGGYIKRSVKRLCYRVYNYKNSKYLKASEEQPLKAADLDTSFFDTTVDDWLISNSLLSFINKLPEREREVIKHYYGLDGYIELYLKDIAKMYNLSPERIRKIKDRAIARLRSWLKYNNLKMEDFING